MAGFVAQCYLQKMPHFWFTTLHIAFFWALLCSNKNNYKMWGVWYYQMQDQLDKQRCSLLRTCVNGRGELDMWTDCLLMWCENCPGQVVAQWCHNELASNWMNFLITFGTCSGCSFEPCCCKQMKIRYFTVISFTFDASFPGSSICHICKLLSSAINVLYCYWSVLGWVITHLVLHCGAFGSVLCDGCLLVPLEEKKKCIFMATINLFHNLQKGEYSN